ncbi:MAG TPA: HupE/UreJ family protein [Rhizomicrobium sp.]
MVRRISLAALLLLGATAAAEAHTGEGATHGFFQGVGHPLGGLDHILAMVTVGLFAARLGGRALWLVPGAFVAMMAFGGVLGMAGLGLPFAEIGIGLSVVVLGLVVALQADMAAWAAMAMVGVFALFHGHGHGAEMPATASGLEYGIGFVLATALLHLGGVGLGLLASRGEGRFGRRVLQGAGGAVSVAGVAILAGLA